MDGFRFFFFSDEHEPRHVHVENGESYARIEIDTLKVTDAYRCSPGELKKIVRMVENHRLVLQKAWDEHFHQT